MTKESIKEKLLNAVKSNPNIVDIKYVAIFGSYVNGTPRDDSDVDVLIDFYPQATVGLFKYVDIQVSCYTSMQIMSIFPVALSFIQD